MTASTSDLTVKLDRYIRARYPLVAIVSHEEARVLESIERISHTRGRRAYTWTITRGLQPIGDLGNDQFEGTQDPVAAFTSILAYQTDEEPTIFVMLDLHSYLQDPMVVRFIRDIASRFETCRHTLLLLSPLMTVPPELDKTAVVMDWDLPTVQELHEILDTCERDLPEQISITLNGNRDKVVQALRGLTRFEASSVLLSAIAATGELGECVVPLIVAEKKQIVRKSGVLEFVETSETMSNVGGLPHLKNYAARKRMTFSAAAREAGLEPARGVLLLGLPGTGKSLSAKAIAGGEMPLLRMDVGALMNQYVGGSERNVREAFRVAEAIAPCVVWIDEIEKALGGGGGEHDGGTTDRVVATILTHMQETTSPIYFVATANDVRALRPELIGRFDDVIFCDLPGMDDRIEILAVHLRKRRQDPQKFDLKAAAEATWGFVGREIERVVKSGMELAFSAGEAFTTQHLLSAAASVVPLSNTMESQISDLRKWAKNRALSASNPLDPQPGKANSGRTVEV